MEHSEASSVLSRKDGCDLFETSASGDPDCAAVGMLPTVFLTGLSFKVVFLCHFLGRVFLA